MSDLINRQDAIERITNQYQDSDGGRDRYAVGINVGITKAMNTLKDMPSAQPEVKKYLYPDYANAMMMMWLDEVLTDNEYDRIMYKLSEHEKKSGVKMEADHE